MLTGGYYIVSKIRGVQKMSNLVQSTVIAASMPLVVAIPLIILIGIGLGALGFFGGMKYYVKSYERRMNSAKVTAGRIVEEANEAAKTTKREAILEAKEEVHKLRTEFDKESKERRIEIQRAEARIIQKEESLDKRAESVESLKKSLSHKEGELLSKQQQLQNRLDTAERDIKERTQSADQAIKEKQDSAEKDVAYKLEKAKTEADALIAKADEQVQKIAKLTREQAKALVISQIEDDAKRESATLVRALEQKARDEADKKAKEIVGLAIQRCAVEHTAEITSSVVQLPSEEMKGRIIGREGRNIRALENATGIDFIVDDTPEVVILSGFDPIRREIAKLTLEKLILDGRIHPSRIEEMVERVKRDLDIQIKEVGEAATFESGVFNLHPEIVKTLGRLKYRTSYGQNVLKHSMEVAYLAGLMAQELGVDAALAKRGGLLHDLGKATDYETEGTHVQLGVELAKKYGESADIINCIEAHHGDVEPTSIEAVLVAVADAISGSRPGARRESLESYIKRLQKLEEISNSFAGVDKSYAIQAGREVRIIVNPQDIDDAQALFLSKEIARKIEDELDYPGQIKVHVIREVRKVEYAK